jgi:glycosyltransferase involved in cell wall biosynthesis
MHIALITPGFSADEHDWCIPALAHLVRHLAREHQVDVFALRYPHQPAVYQAFGARVFALGGATSGGAQRIPLLTRALRALLSNGPYDLIQGLWADEPGFLAMLGARIGGTRSIVSLMGGELIDLPDLGYGGRRSAFNRVLCRLALAGANAITAGSASLAQLAAPHTLGKLVHRLPLGVATDFFYPPSDLQSAICNPQSAIYNLLHIASLVPVKDQATLLRAFARIVAVSPQTQLNMVGDGPLRTTLQNQATQLGISAHIKWHGDVAHHQLPEYYRAADLFLISSRYESQSLVVLEAAACGLPSVGTAVGILPELAPIVTSVPINDDAAFADAILDLLHNQRKRKALAALGPQRIAVGYRVEDYISALFTLAH